MRGVRSRKMSLRKRKRILGFDLSAAAIDPVSDLQVIDNEKLKSIAEHGSEKLEKMIKKASK